MDSRFKLLLILFILLSSKFAFCATEDFSTYTEGDPGTDVTVTATKVTYTAVETRDSNTHLYKDYGVDYFTSHFTHDFTVCNTANTDDYNGVVLNWGLSNDAATIYKSWVDGVYVGLYRSNGSADTLQLSEWDDNPIDTTSQTVGTIYYCTVARNGTAWTCYVFTDAARTTLKDVLAITSSNDDFRYLYVLGTYDTNSQRRQSGYTENLTLNTTTSNTVSLNSTIDTYIWDANVNTNYDTQGLQTKLGDANYTRSSLLTFDLSSIPSNARITSITFSEVISANAGAGPGTITLYKCLRTWVENQATWNAYSTGNNWGTAGCLNTTTDYSTTILGTITIAGQLANSTVTFVNSYGNLHYYLASVIGGTANFTQKSNANMNFNTYDSENATVGNRPLLTINYETPTVTTSTFKPIINIF